MYYDTHINGGEYSSLILGNVICLWKLLHSGKYLSVIPEINVIKF